MAPFLTSEEQPLSGKQQVGFAFAATLGSMILGLLAAFVMIQMIRGTWPGVDLPRWGIIMGEALIIAPLLVLLRWRRIPLRDALRVYPISGTTYRACVAIGVGVTVLVDELDRILDLILPRPESLMQAMDMLTYETPGEALLVYAGAALIAPLVEEMVFRGFFQKQLEEGYMDATKAVLYSAALFTLLHLNPWWGLQIYLLGMVLGFMAWRTGSIWPAVIVHGINNGLAVLFTNLPSGSTQWYRWGEHVSPLMLLVAGLSLYMGFRSLLAENPEPMMSSGTGELGVDEG